MDKKSGDNLVKAFVSPFTNDIVSITSVEQFCMGVNAAIVALAQTIEGEITPRTKYHAALALVTALMLNPYALIEAGWDGYAEPEQDN